jgi:large subunit ribosomal protein L4
MSNAVVLNENFENNGELALPSSYAEINAHNLYLYAKSYLASQRANTARVKNRSEVSGGGKKPKAQKGSGGARWGSKRSPLFVGGGQVFGPTKRNYNQKINKKTKSFSIIFCN